MTDLLNKAYDSEDFRKLGHEIVDLLADYLQFQKSSKAKKVLPWQNPDNLLSKWQNNFPNSKNPNIKDIYKELLNDSIHIHNPNYMWHQVCPPLPISAVAELYGSILNNGQAIYEMGPAANIIERIIIEWISGKFNYPKDAFGILTSGGSIGNLTALLATRQSQTNYDAWEKGNIQTQFAIMVSEQAHYSVSRAIKIMGWREQGIIKLPVDKNFKVDINQLEKIYANAKAKNIKVIALVANVCNTATGTFDPINEMADFCKKYNIWLHADKRKKLTEDGHFYIVQTDLKEETWLRVTLMNPFTTEKNIKEMLNALKGI